MTSKWREWAAAGTATLVAMAALPATAAAEERTCRGTLGAIVVDNLRVPQGATCSLNGTRVKGTVKVERGATLYASGVRVVGNVQAEGARNVVVGGSSTVGGSVQIVQGLRATVRSSRIEGSIQYEQQRGYLTTRGNVVGADVQLFSNTGGAAVFYNRVDGNLQCKSNVPRPTGGGNVVQGNKEDQCARF